MSNCYLLHVTPSTSSGQINRCLDYITFDFKSTIQSLSSSRWFRPTSSKLCNDAIFHHSKELAERKGASVFNVSIIDFENLDPSDPCGIEPIHQSIETLIEQSNIQVVFIVNTFKAHMVGLYGVFELLGFREITPGCFMKDANSKPNDLEFDTFRFDNLFLV